MPAERRAALSQRLPSPTSALLDALEVVVDLGLDPYVIAALDAGIDPDLAFARAANEIAGDLDGLGNLTSERTWRRCAWNASGELSATQAKSVLAEILAHGGEPSSIARTKGFERLDSGALGEIVATVDRGQPRRVVALPRAATRSWRSSSLARS